MTVFKNEYLSFQPLQCHNHIMTLNIGTASVKFCGKFIKGKKMVSGKKGEMSVCGLQVSLPFVVQIDLKIDVWKAHW